MLMEILFSPRFRARSKRKEAYASHQACKEAGELAKQKKAARYSSRALAEWPRKRSSSVITDDSNTGPIDHPKKPGDVGDGWAAEVQECLFPPLHQASALTIPTSSLRDSFDDDLPPLSPFSSEEEDDWAFSETSDSDHELPIAPYDSD